MVDFYLVAIGFSIGAVITLAYTAVLSLGINIVLHFKEDGKEDTEAMKLYHKTHKQLN